MKKWIVFGIVGLLVLGALALGMTGSAYAQDDTIDPAEQVNWLGKGPGFGRGIRDQVSLEAAAEVLGMTPEELSTQLWGGKTLADLAEEKGVALEDVRAAAVAAQQQAARAAIAQAVEDGKITQAHADWLLEGIDQGFINGFGGRFGIGGRRGFHSHGFEELPDATTVTPSTDS